MTDGILIIDKPVDWTSHDVVGKLRKLLKTKRIGHTGTLDPFATGVLVLLIGQATRLAQFLDKDQKEYEATILFGFETDTGDQTGALTVDSKFKFEELVEILRKTDWNNVFADFIGQTEQVPPMYSAKKIEGQKLYELARKGIEVERKPVSITIHELELLEVITNSQARIRIRVACSAGTYIRTLAEDIGRKIGVPCHLCALRRTRAGKFSIARAVTLENLEKAEFISMNEALSHLSEIRLNEAEVKKVRNGMSLRTDLNDDSSNFVRLTDEANNLISVGQMNREKSVIQPKIVFMENS